jgi:hypothetical protein
MREHQEVFERFRELYDRALKERKDRFLSVAPCNCVHNVRLRVKGKGQFGFCQNSLVLANSGKKWFVCDAVETAQRCRVFSCRNTEASVEQKFMEIVKSPAWCGKEYPKLAMLIWFLQEWEPHGRMVRFREMLRKMFGALWGIISFRWW